MDFRQIEAFVHVVRLKSFSRAADAVFLTQPTISTHISALENELGVKLIDRSGKEVAPTRAGKLFLDYAVNLMNTRDQAIHTLCEFSNQLQGSLEIAASSVPGQYILPLLMRKFLDKYKNVNFSMLQLDSKQVIEALLDKNVELGIVGTKPDNSKLEYVELQKDKLVIITPNSGKFSEITTNTLPLDFLKNENFIIRESGSGTRQEFERILHENKINMKAINITAQMNSIEAIKQAVSMGLGISIASLLSVNDYIDFGLIKAYEIENLDLSRSFYIVYHKNRPLSPISNTFLDFTIQNYSCLK